MILFASSAVASEESTSYVYEEFNMINASKYTISTGYAHEGACVFNGSFYFTNIDSTPASINLYKKMVHWVDMDLNTEIKNNFVKLKIFPAPEQLFEIIHEDDELIFRMQTPHNGATLVCDFPFIELLDEELDGDGFPIQTICVDDDLPKGLIELRGDDAVLYLINRIQPFTGKNLCKYENGQISEVTLVKDGRWNGKSTYFYQNGQKGSEGDYKDDKKDGKWIGWYENGQRKYDRNYKDNVCISGDC